MILQLLQPRQNLSITKEKTNTYIGILCTSSICFLINTIIYISRGEYLRHEIKIFIPNFDIHKSKKRKHQFLLLIKSLFHLTKVKLHHLFFDSYTINNGSKVAAKVNHNCKTKDL